jgi:hypothetical protein
LTRLGDLTRLRSCHVDSGGAAHDRRLTYTGYDASAHVAEETRNASVAAPKGIVLSVLVSVIGGFILLYSITASIQDNSEEGLTALAASDTGLPPAQIFLDSLGNPDVAKFLLFIVCVAQYFCGMASVTANSRMSFAFSRDHALPGSRIWSKVNPRTGTPTNSQFVPGPWNLGRWSAPIGWLAVGWVVIICILFVLPPAYPITVNTFNYAPIAVLVVLIIATLFWLLGGKRTFMEGRDVEHTTKSLGAVLDE